MQPLYSLHHMQNSKKLQNETVDKEKRAVVAFASFSCFSIFSYHVHCSPKYILPRSQAPLKFGGKERGNRELGMRHVRSEGVTPRSES